MDTSIDNGAILDASLARIDKPDQVCRPSLPPESRRSCPSLAGNRRGSLNPLPGHIINSSPYLGERQDLTPLGLRRGSSALPLTSYGGSRRGSSMQADRRGSSFLLPESRRSSVKPDLLDDCALGGNMTFDYIFDTIGQMGRWQMLVFAMTFAIDSTIFLAILYFSQEAFAPDWIWRSCTGVMRKNGTAVDWMNKTNWCPPTGITCTNLTFRNGFSSMTTEWDFVCGKIYLVRLTGSLFFAGFLGGAIINGQLTDLFGRRRTTLVFWSALILLQTAVGLSVAWYMYIAIRIGVGICGGACFVSSGVIPIENVGPKYRAIVAVRFGFHVTFLVASLLFHLIDNWRHLAFATGLFWVPALPLLVMYLPESARWLIQKDRIAEAEKVVRKMAAFNKKPVPDVTFLTRSAKADRRRREYDEKYTYLDLFNGKYALRTLTVMYSWFWLMAVTYGMIANLTEFKGELSIKLSVIGVVSLVMSVLSSIAVNRIGRKIAFAVSTSIAVICNFGILGVDMQESFPGKEIVRTSFAIVAVGASTASYTPLLCFCSEAYPTLVRSLATSAATAVGRVGSILAPQIGLLALYHTSAPYITFGALGLVGTILAIVIMPETKGHPLLEDLQPRRKCYSECSCFKVRARSPTDAGIAVAELAAINNRDYRRDYCEVDFTSGQGVAL